MCFIKIKGANMKKELSILCLSAGILLGGCSSKVCDENCSLFSCKEKSGCITHEKQVVPEVTLNATSYFKTDSAQLNMKDKNTLDQVVSYLQNNESEHVRINGYTDNTGPASYNMGLSQRRAKAVADYLIRNGISADRIETTGYGATNFAYSNNTPAERAKNRRAEILFFK